MIYVSLVHLGIGILVGLYLISFIYSSIREKRIRAVFISAILALVFIIAWAGTYYFWEDSNYILITADIVFIILAMLFFMPVRKPAPIVIGDQTEQVDERDTMFAREEYLRGTAKNEIYYKLNPERKIIDDKIREIPKMLDPGGRYYDPVYSKYIESIFSGLRDYLNSVDGKISPDKIELDSARITRTIKQYILNLGAIDVGIGPLNQAYVYSHVGRGPSQWGSPIVNNHKYAIMFSMEMRYNFVEGAPKLSITHESAQQYLNAAMISIPLANFIRRLGYSARAHIAGSNYQIMMTPVAYDAGLGEPGRIGYLVSPYAGARVRLGGITTDIPLVTDHPITFGVQEFCEKCKKCAINCPSGAIPKDGKTIVRGVEKWQLDIERCMRFWRICGTDCGLCMKTCPYSHPNTLSHNLIRAAIKRSPIAQYISIWADDIVYGKKEKLARL